MRLTADDAGSCKEFGKKRVQNPVVFSNPLSSLAVNITQRKNTEKERWQEEKCLKCFCTVLAKQGGQ